MIKRKMFAGGDKLMFEKAALMRRQPTFAEDLLWNYLRTKPVGFKFRRQHVYGSYILDFYSNAVPLAIEVDGSIHAREDIQRNDAIRQAQLEEAGLTFLRFTNEQVRLQLAEVQQEIETFLQLFGHPAPPQKSAIE